MSKTRLEAFSNSVLAIIIMIMVLELKTPFDEKPTRYWEHRISLIKFAHNLMPGSKRYFLSFKTHSSAIEDEE